MPTADLCVLREEDRFLLTGISRVHWWRLEREGKVPKRIPLGVNSVGWLRHEIEEWIASRSSERDLAGLAVKLRTTLHLRREEARAEKKARRRAAETKATARAAL